MHQAGFTELAARRIGTGSQITCITDDSTSPGGKNRRIAIGARDKRILVVELDSKGDMTPIFSVTLDKTVPSGLTFADYENVYVFGHYDGDVHLLRGSDGRVLSSQNVGTPM
jgi:hypothetical protein